MITEPWTLESVEAVGITDIATHELTNLPGTICSYKRLESMSHCSDCLISETTLILNSLSPDVILYIRARALKTYRSEERSGII